MVRRLLLVHDTESLLLVLSAHVGSLARVSEVNQSCLYDLSILIEVRITEFNHQTSASPSLVEERRGKGVIKTHLKDCCPGSWTLKLLSVDSSGELTTCFFNVS